MTSTLDQLKSMTVVVADTGDIDAVREHKPQDCTTNPSIVLKTVQDPDFSEHFARAVSEGKSADNPIETIATDLTVTVGAELSKIVPGRVSTEVDARLSYDRAASISRAKELIEAYEKRGISKDRILIKLASTWEGIQAAKALEKEGINCNLTLLFSLGQAAACADAGVFLISPFVGRITDWFGQKTGETYTAQTDPGVASVKKIYDYYKSNGIETIVMGASFRNLGQITALAGCDRLTISPNFLSDMASSQDHIDRMLSPESHSNMDKIDLGEADFRWDLGSDAMATEKLAEGIRKFDADTSKLHSLIASSL